MYLITAPKRGNTAGNNVAIVAEITDKVCVIALFIVEMVVETTAINFILNNPIVEVVVDTTDSILDQIFALDKVATSVAE